MQVLNIVETSNLDILANNLSRLKIPKRQPELIAHNPKVRFVRLEIPDIATVGSMLANL